MDCLVAACPDEVLARGLCSVHYQRMRRHGTVNDPRPSFADAFWDKVQQGTDAECWPWLGGKRATGYGTYRRQCSHRVAYELVIGPIPAGLELDHLCRSPSCCNPSHLEPVTRRENILRSNNFAGQRARQTHCKRGHAFTPENTRINNRGNRSCRACENLRYHTYKNRVREMLAVLGLNESE